jgi:hypothetical protein
MRNVSRRPYRPVAEWLEDRTVLSPAPALPLTPPKGTALAGIASSLNGKILGHAVATPKAGVSPASATSQQFADLTALLFASEAPDLPAAHLPAQPVPFSAYVLPPKVGVYPVPAARYTTRTGAFGGIVPDTTGAGDGYQVFFLPASGVEKGLWLQMTQGQAYRGEVVTVTLPSDAKPTARYEATIDWGDGSAASTGTIHVTGKQVGVDGQHIYLHGGRYPVKVHVEIEGVSVGDVTGTATVVPQAPPLAPPATRREPGRSKLKLGPQSKRSPHAEGWAILAVAVGLFKSRPAEKQRA